MAKVNNRSALRHSAEHILTQAMINLYGNNKVIMAMGPATDDGFYFDFDSPDDFKISEADFPKIEKEMKKIIKGNLPFKKQVLSVEEARKLFKDNLYKQEWLDEIEKDGKKAIVYWTDDDFVDLCSGPHLKSTGEIKAFKLLSVAGAYWHGDEKNKMLTRVYGTAFRTKESLEKHLKLIEEAKKRDHRKLGKELDLFTFSNLVGSGLPLYTPKGTTIRRELYQALYKISQKYGVEEVTTPHIAKMDIYKISGHADKFSEELLLVKSHYGEEFVMRPVTCPHHTQIYASRPRSYRELPLRFMETTMMYRDEKPGQISGLTRVRSISIDDGHTFCTVEQIKEEAKNLCLIIEEFYKNVGLWGNHWVSLSLSDPKTPEKYIGQPDEWRQAELMIKAISKDLNLGAKKMVGEAALYGPKIDYMFKDALGNERQLATVQIDFSTPKKFGLEYIDSSGKKKTPVMVHRAILGSYERFMAILIEHYAGAFPLWLAPVQVLVLPITDKVTAYAKIVSDHLKKAGIRTELDDSDETLSKKIRKAEIQKVPYMLIVGEKEEKEKRVTVRQRGQEKQQALNLTDFSKKAKQEIEEKTIF